MVPAPHVANATDWLEVLSDAANPAGGWSYYAGKASRLEPTCWALLALAQNESRTAGNDDLHREFLERCQRPEGWLVEDPRWPVNIAFNAIVAFTWLRRQDIAAESRLQALLGSLVAAKGVRAPQSASYEQDNSLQGWAWMTATFSWVEPTAWGILALQKAVRAGVLRDEDVQPRIDEAERLLIDRCCRDGGWNFGNANVMGQDLFPHVPTTAIALLALQARRDASSVTRSLAFLEAHATDESSMLALGLSLICLRTYGRAGERVEAQLRATAQREQGASGANRRPAEFRNLHAVAVAATALTLENDDTTFRI